MYKDQWIITFGGPDRCGKTSIAKEISRQYCIPYFKPSNQRQFAIQDPEQFQHQTRWGEPKLFDFLKQTGHSAILDRGYPCDWAYSVVFGRVTAWDTIEVLDQLYSTLRAVNVFTLRHDYAGLKDDTWSDVTEKRLVELDEAYQEYAIGAITPTLVLFTDDQNLPKQVKTIIDFLQENRL